MENDNIPNEEFWKDKIKLVDNSEFITDKKAKHINDFKNTLKENKKYYFKFFIFLFIFIIAYIASKYGFLTIYIFILGFIFIWYNLDNKDKKQNEINNKKFSNKKFNSENIITDPDILYEKSLEYRNKLSKFGNKECYCGSTIKYKKCCRNWDNRFGIQRHLKDNNKELVYN